MLISFSENFNLFLDLPYSILGKIPHKLRFVFALLLKIFFSIFRENLCEKPWLISVITPLLNHEKTAQHII